MRAIETPEMLGCIVLTEGARQELTHYQAEVVAVGAPTWCVDENCERCNRLTGIALYPEAFTHPLDIAAGDWVVIAPRSLTETDIPGISCVHQDDVLAVLTEKAPISR